MERERRRCRYGENMEEKEYEKKGIRKA